MKEINVLVIEDSVYSADLNIRELKKAGFIVQHKIAADRKSMQEALRDRQWDIILSDNNMPGFDALQAIGIRNKSGSRAPFIIVSEDISEKDVRKAVEMGCCAYLPKENLKELGRQVERILASI